MTAIAVALPPPSFAQPKPLPAAETDVAEFNVEQLDAMLAPIALYPDELLTQILIASSYPLQVVAVSRWLEKGNNKELQGDALVKALDNGTWTVQGREIPGTRCGDWLVRLSNVRGTLSGVVLLARGTFPIRDLKLMPDGSFSGSTQAGVVGSTYARAYKISGRFSGDTVHLTLKNDICPARHGVATRRPAGY